VVLALFAVLAAAQRVYVYEVESDVEIAEDVPHVPGVSWRFGEQLLVVWVPRDVAPGIILFTNETAPSRCTTGHTSYSSYLQTRSPAKEQKLRRS
jgi:hypothetical protein